MKDTIREQRVKGRERTRRCRARQKQDGVPQSLRVDQVLLHAFMHLQSTGRLGLTMATLGEVINEAKLVLRRNHDQEASKAMISKRMKFHAKGEWIKAARAFENDPPNPEAVKWLAEQGLI